MKKEFAIPQVMNSFSPISFDEAEKFISVGYEMAKAQNPELPDRPQIVFTAGWYQAIEKQPQ